MIKAVLFDLDGTLLPMDQDKFIQRYFGELVIYLSKYGYEKDTLIPAIWKGTAAAVKNTGERTNEEAFRSVMFEVFGEKIQRDMHLFDIFYEDKFDDVKSSCGYSERSKEIVDLVKSKGVLSVLATNPVFPRVATEKRVKWAGLDKDDFVYISTFENSTGCKPNPEYYLEILKKLSLSPDECIMIGNDTSDDLAALSVGIKTFILTDCLINTENKDLKDIPHGSFSELFEFINSHFE